MLIRRLHPSGTLALAALVAIGVGVACDLNPQPLPPGEAAGNDAGEVLGPPAMNGGGGPEGGALGVNGEGGAEGSPPTATSTGDGGPDAASDASTDASVDAATEDASTDAPTDAEGEAD